MTKQIKSLSPSEIIAGEDALIDFQFAIIEAMHKRQITQVQFAEMLGISRARVSQLLSSEANPTIKLVGRALHALDLCTDYKSKKTEEVKASEPFVAEEENDVNHVIDDQPEATAWANLPWVFRLPEGSKSWHMNDNNNKTGNKDKRQFREVA
jgi:transcriptional regulator with XRE-family HTH domain